jgi:hypothetical protein
MIGVTGAGQPEYMITADDCDIKLAIDCVPMDEMGRRGELVMVMANDGRSISQDPMMKDQIVSYITNGYASFDGQFLEGPSEEPLEPAVLILRRSTYELRRTDSRKVISEKYAADVSVCCMTLSQNPYLSFSWSLLFCISDFVSKSLGACSTMSFAKRALC